jgi:hypothetical protein
VLSIYDFVYGMTPLCWKHSKEDECFAQSRDLFREGMKTEDRGLKTGIERSATVEGHLSKPGAEAVDKRWSHKRLVTRKS